jgi:DNA repair exonuclease SbcCD nuclease subunit
MRFLHCADIHLDSPLRGLERYAGAPVDEVRGATRRAFENLVQHALRERVDFVVIAGDLYDGDWPDFNTGLFFARGMAQLGESGIAVYVLRGNHDAASRLTHALPLPKNVRLFSHSKPETFLDENLGLAIHGQSFATAAVLEDLAAGYPQAVRGLVNIGVLHTSLTGRPGHDPYGPTSEAVLRSKGYDYWALGHVHAREIVLKDPWVVYPGNLQGRHIREPGAKGCELVTIMDGRITTNPVALDVLRWKELIVEVDGLPDVDAVLERASGAMQAALAQADGRILGMRIRLQGAAAGHRVASVRPEVLEAQLRNAAVEVASGRAWLEKVQVQVRPQRALERLAAGDDPVGLLLRELRSLGQEPDRLALLAQETLKDLRAKLPAEISDEEALRLTTPEDLEELLREVEGDLLARFSGGGSA